jgi:hypothetical protein
MLDRDQIIKQIEANIFYYSQFTETGPKGTRAHANSSIDVLMELLQQIRDYDEVFDVREKRLTAEDLEDFT